MATKVFPTEMSDRGTVLGADKLLIWNSTSGSSEEYTTVTKLTKIVDDKISASQGSLLGGIAYDASAPTPAANGRYIFTSEGSCAWITGGAVTVKINDEVLVTYTAPSTYTYTYLSVASSMIIKQAKGTSETDVMSQKAVSDYLDQLLTYAPVDGIILNNTTTTDFSIVTATGYSHISVMVNEGDVYYVKGFGTSIAKIWATYTKEGTLKRVSVNMGAGSGLDITIESGEDILIVNSETDSIYVECKSKLPDIINNAFIGLNSVNTQIYGNLLIEQYLIGAGARLAKFIKYPESYNKIKIKLTKDDDAIYTTGYSLFRADASDNITYLQACAFGVEYEIDAAEGFPKLFFFNGAYLSAGEELNLVFTFNTTDSIAARIEKFERTNEQKTIVCFGDSITEFVDVTYRGYADYFPNTFDCITYKAGIGGTRIAQRETPTITPSDTNAAYAGLDVVNMVKAWTTNDYTIVDACCLYLKNNASDDNTAIIDRLKEITPAETDIITIFAGTNDFTGQSPFGTALDLEDGTSNGTIWGALKYMIKAILTANPRIKIYVFTPIVRYVDPISAENWSDTKELSGVKLPDIVELLQEITKSKHIPCCDLYWTMGWNETNFTEFFGSDSTHPLFGFEPLGEKMARFIKNN